MRNGIQDSSFVSKGKTSRSHLTGVRLSDCDSVTTPRGENHDGCMHRDDTVRHLLRSIRCTQPTQARVLLSVSFSEAWEAQQATHDPARPTMSEVAQKNAVVCGYQLKPCSLCAEEWYAQRRSPLGDIGISQSCHTWCENRHLLRNLAQSISTLIVQKRRISNFRFQLILTDASCDPRRWNSSFQWRPLP
jgi:hypothetical protein